LERVSRESSLDIEALEFFVRGRVHEAGARALGKVLEGVGRGHGREPLVCAQNHLPARMQSLGLHEKRLRTILGVVAYRRSA